MVSNSEIFTTLPLLLKEKANVPSDNGAKPTRGYPLKRPTDGNPFVTPPCRPARSKRKGNENERPYPTKDPSS